MEEINAVTPQQLETLKKNFHEKVAAQSPGFHPDDLERVKTDELWLRRFIAHAESNMENAVTLLYDCCQWRKEFGTNDLDETKLAPEIFLRGTLFVRNKDKWGKKLLIFKGKQHTKGTVDMELIQKFVVYWFERIERESNSDQISIIFDMKDTGWNNMDMDFIRYFITLLKTYYPYFVNYLVIFEMPWLLNAAWKIIKGWLPPKFVDRVKFQDKKTLKEYIDVDDQLAEWGGTDNYVYKFEPVPKGKRMQNNNSNGILPETKSRNKVQFTGNERAREIHQIDYTEINGDSGTPTTASPIPSATERIFTQSNDNCLAEVEDRITFRASDSDDHYSAQLIVKNISPNGNPLIVKIKTTSPERYRVKPIIFVLNRNARGTVNIETHPGVSASTMSRDRFQVQIAIIPSDMIPHSTPNASDSGPSSTYFNDLGNNFRQIVNSGTTFETYKISVVVEARPGDTATGTSIVLNDDRLRKGLGDLEKKITESVANKVIAEIDRAQRRVLIMLGVIAFLFLCILAFLVKMSGDCTKCGGTGISSVSQGFVNVGNEGSCGAIQ